MPLDRDFRKLPPSTPAELRRVAVNMVLGGTRRIEVADAIGVNRRFVGQWLHAYQQAGDAALAGGRRGRRPGEQKTLTERQEAMIRRLVAGRCPDQLKLPFALWTREAVGQLIERKTGLRLCLTTIGSYLAAWGFTAQKPIRRATERDAAAVQAWLAQDYPAIVKRARKERAEISSVTNQGKLQFMIYNGALNTAIFLQFLRRLIKDADRKLFVIVDNLRVHRAKSVTAWVADNVERIELFYLPPYAPEHNPDEYVNNDVKQAMGRRATPMDKAAMRAGLRSHMRGLQRRPDKVRSFFQAPDVRYAA